MKYQIHRSHERGNANHGWLKAKHSFSFAHWYNPEKIHFGALRVLNDDEIAPGMGFGKHPHDNMEIITLVQEGALAHNDSLGNGSVIHPDEVQVMSAGTGVFHSEVNHLKNQPTRLFQIWIIPEKLNVTPRYEQKKFLPEQRKNKWQEIIKPHTQQNGEAIFIYQQAWFSLCDLEESNEISYVSKNPHNGVYIFVIEGEIEINQEKLHKRDAMAISNYDSVLIKSKQNSRILSIDVPLIKLN
jgi:redox-sensitive bicupin YhaK (pirin superfamily)